MPQSSTASRSPRQPYRDAYNDWPAMTRVLEKMSDMAGAAEIIIAEHEGQVIGAVGYMPPLAPKAAHFKPEWPIVRMLVVDPVARGLGAGRVLTEGLSPLSGLISITIRAGTAALHMES